MRLLDKDPNARAESAASLNRELESLLAGLEGNMVPSLSGPLAAPNASAFDATEAQALSDAIAAGEYSPLTGPLNKQDGSAWLAEGETADATALAGMNFYVEGLTGEIPN